MACEKNKDKVRCAVGPQRGFTGAAGNNVQTAVWAAQSIPDKLLSVQNMTDQAQLAAITGDTTEDTFIRLEATSRLTDQTVLTQIAQTEPYFFLRTVALQRITDPEIRLGVVQSETSPDVLAQAAQDEDYHVKEVAIQRLEKMGRLDKLIPVYKTGKACYMIASTVTDKAFLTQMAIDCPDKSGRWYAIVEIGDSPKQLKKIALQSNFQNTRRDAVWEIKMDAEALAAIAEESDDEDVRFCAKKHRYEIIGWKPPDTTYPGVLGRIMRSYPFLYSTENHALNRLFLGTGYEWQDGGLIDMDAMPEEIIVEERRLSRKERGLTSPLSPAGFPLTKLEPYSEYARILHIPDNVRPDWLDAAQQAVDLGITLKWNENALAQVQKRIDALRHSNTPALEKDSGTIKE